MSRTDVPDFVDRSDHRISNTMDLTIKFCDSFKYMKDIMKANSGIKSLKEVKNTGINADEDSDTHQFRASDWTNIIKT
ncbi:hypothetical protein BELL_0318g00100 [Botrytis elliptica]|uniref:Uncharacterized protein n=1 Tax=Botrytis elliptica TaxID=278938 RepID=A0A4Z1JJT2_9HELO|nr:hypothetical protein BELL_0318g00100 [Botrytis elliptica]